jgi:ABC-type spermidine/putrescine transport system permease subunit II
MVFVVMLFFRNSGIISRFFFQISLIDNLDQFPSLLYEKYGLGIILTYVLKGTPFISLFVLNLMNQISESYDDVAFTLGAGEYQLLKKVYLPLSKDMIVWCGMILFAYDFGSFEVPYLLGIQKIQMLSVLLYSSYISPGIDIIPTTMAIAIILLILGGLLAYLFGKFLLWLIHFELPESFLRMKITKKFKKKRGVFVHILYLIMMVGGLITTIYMILLSMHSYFRYPILMPSGFTLDYWKNIFIGNPLFYRGLFSSLFIGTITALLSTLFGFIAARGIAKYYPNLSGRLLFILTIPLFIPGIALFLGVHQVMIYSLFVNHWISVVLGHMLICLPYTINIGVSYFKGISPTLEEVAMTLGSFGIKRYTFLILPMIAPGIGLSCIISFLISNTEYFSVFLIGGGNTITLSMIMYPYISNADQSMASVVGVIFMTLNLLIFYLTNRFLKKSATYKSLYGGY